VRAHHITHVCSGDAGRLSGLKEIEDQLRDALAVETEEVAPGHCGSHAPDIMPVSHRIATGQPPALAASVGPMDSTPAPQAAAEDWPAARAAVLRNAAGIGLATGAYALSFGAIATATGLSVLQTCVLSLAMFTGASQYALVGVLGAGGGALTAAATSLLLGTRNVLYGLRLSPLLQVRGLRKLVAAQLVIDESTAMSLGRGTAKANRLGFWATGISVYVLWNLGTLIGALGAQALANPRAVGLDAAAPAAFLALLAPRVRTRSSVAVAAAAAAVAMATVPFLPVGGPVLVAALVAIVVGAVAHATAEAG
jgi:predicted branched-subunit amino acid permease